MNTEKLNGQQLGVDQQLGGLEKSNLQNKTNSWIYGSTMTLPN